MGQWADILKTSSILPLRKRSLGTLGDNVTLISGAEVREVIIKLFGVKSELDVIYSCFISRSTVDFWKMINR